MTSLIPRNAETDSSLPIAVKELLQNAYGIRQILIPLKSDLGVDASKSSSDVTAVTLKKAFGFVTGEVLSAVESELLQKMILAMKLDVQTGATPIVQADFSQAENWSWGVSFCEIPSDFQSKAHGFWLQTVGPRELMSQPQLKKKTWDDLQKIMAHLSS